VRDLIGDAVLAPSSHNTQPWIFGLDGDRIALYADRTRALPVNDPFDRELTISCGAALEALCLAARARGRVPRVTVLPGDDPDLLAVVELGEGAAVAPRDAALLAAARTRRTVREPFDDRHLPEGLMAALVEGAEGAGAWLEPIDDDRRRGGLAGLVAEGDRVQFADPPWRRKLASWMHPRRRGEGLAVPMAALPVTRLVVSALDLGGRTAGRDADLVAGAPGLAVLGTRGDGPADWLAAGRALQRVLVEASARGVQAGHLNQPCQVADLRPRLAGLAGRPGLPQVVLRLGYPRDGSPAAPRRPVAEVIEEGRA
jgi:hypothetical protein